jgi:gliding motility-associated-like protein
VSLTVENEAGCNDVYQKTITIDPLPDLRLPSDTLICVNDQIDLTVSGGDVISWFPPTGLSDTSAFSLTAHPSFSTTYSVAVTDTLTGCINEGALTIDVQQKPSAEVRMDTHSIVVGDQVYLYADSLSWAIAEWSPAELVECVNCYSTYARPLEDETFVLTLQDTNQCFSEDFFADVAVRESYTVAMPTAFIPGDGNGNSQVKVKGHGIKELIEFSIYNRWGNRIFSTNQLDEGWDGTFNGKVQNSDTYTYIVKVIFWNGEEKLKKGTISLLR